MDLFQTLLPIATLLLGWGLGQLDDLIGDQRRKKRAIARALTDLLDLRHSLLQTPRAMEKIGDELGASAEQWERFSPLIFQRYVAPMVDFGSLRRRYREAVTVLSEHRPVLAYRLRSKDILIDLNRLSSLAEEESSSTALTVARLIQSINSAVREHFEDVITSLAKKHGWRTHRQVREILQKPVELPDEMEPFVEELRSELKDASSPSES